MTRLALVDHRRKICFFQSPKSGSTSLSDWLTRNVLYTKPSLSKDQLVVRVFGADFRSAASLVSHHGYFSVAIVRHPARRLVSAFADRIISRNLVAENTDDVIEASGGRRGIPAQRRNAAASTTPQPQFDGTTFDELLDHVEAYLRQGYHGELHPNFNQQVHPKHELFDLHFDLVCAVETLAEDFRPVEEYYEARGPVPHVRGLVGPAAPSGIYDAAADVGLRQSDIGSETCDLLTPDVLGRIADLYEADYRLLGYDPLDLAAPPAIKAGNQLTVDPDWIDGYLGRRQQKRSYRNWFGLRRA